jgi:hypothetical protein
MSAKSFETLPSEILYEISRLLGPQSEDLHSLALVSRRMNEIANHFIHHSVPFNIEYALKFPRQISLAKRVAHHIRKITILSHPHLHQASKTQMFNPERPKFWCWYHDNNPVRADHINQILLRVAGFISDLPALSDLIYSCEGLLPACLADALLSKPMCRLHLNSFTLSALEDRRPHIRSFQRFGSGKASNQLNRHMLEVLTFPNLTTLCVSSGGLPTQALNVQAAQFLVRRFGPNLMNLYLVNEAHSFQRYTLDFLETWEKFTCVGSSTMAPRVGALSTLHLACIDTSAHDLKSWFETTDQTKLRNLKLQLRTIPALQYILAECHFPSLTRISLRIGIPSDHGSDMDREYSELSAQLFAYLRNTPLTDLKIKGTIKKSVFDAILEHLGSKLKKLHVVQSTLKSPDTIDFDEAEIERIGKRCKILRELLVRPSSGSLGRSQTDTVYERTMDGKLKVVSVIVLPAVVTLAG